VPRVFISYSHDSQSHKDWVLRLASDLRAGGIDATIDQWDLKPGQDLVAFMQTSISSSDRVLTVCTDAYRQKADQGSGGAGYERLIVTGELVQNIDTRKFVPIIRDNASAAIPASLGPRIYIDFRADAEYESKLEELLRELHGEPAAAKPPLGPNPFSGTAPSPSGEDRAGPSGLLAATGERLLDSKWFEGHAAAARARLTALGHSGAMEVRLGLHDPIGKSQIELLAAVRESEIRTFGWPIAVLLENRDEYRPRPTADGIRAEIAASEGGERESYDYWAVGNTGSFYLLQSLFEDMRSTNKLFFNTRIVRVTEAFMFGAQLYRNLGASDDARASIRISHFGLRNRELDSSTRARHVFPVSSSEDLSETELTATVSSLDGGDLVRNVTHVVAPLFALFDFTEFDQAVYNDIVFRFTRGEVS
jgi:hypothetical protein